MSDDLNAASQAQAPDVAAPEAAPDERTPIERTMEATYDRVNPPRGDGGRWTSTKPQQPLPQGVTLPADQPMRPEVQQEPKAPEAQAKPLNSLPRDLKGEWDRIAQLSPKIAEWVQKREADAHRRITEMGEAAKASETFNKIAAEYPETFKRSGLPPDETIKRLLNIENNMAVDPQGTIAEMAQAYGVNLPSGGTAIKAIADRYRHTIGNLNESQAFEHLLAAQDFLMKNPVEGLRYLAQSMGIDLAEATGIRQQIEQQHAQANEALIEQFAQGKNDWADLEAEVLAQITAIRATNPSLPAQVVLERAYDAAAKLNPKVSSRRAAEDAKKSETERRRRADEARRFASLNVGSRALPASPKPTGSWEDTMRDVGHRLMGGR